MQRIEQRLRLGMGLDVASIGSSSLQRTIRLRMKAAGAETFEDYERLLIRSATEWNQLVEAVVITETWFFRERQAFSALVNSVLLEWLPRNATGKVRILSLPCSSGEEPYSIAMALLDAGVPAARFLIDGVDLSQNALAKAMAGVFGKNSFRGQDLNFRDRHFQSSGENYVINQAVRECVTFQQANLLGSGFSLGHTQYHFIFCRNLLIYFDRETQRQAFRKLDSLLVRGGTLFVGPAEVPLAMENGFGALTLPMAFACRRSAELPAGRRARTAPKGERPPRHLPPPTSLPAAIVSMAKAAPEAPPGQITLAAARELADSGKLEEAVRICHAHLAEHGASVEAYYLLGVIHDAQGHPDARDFYRKALYLDPNHYECLLQMALLAEKDGDSESAANLRRRAQRLQIQD